MRPACSFDIILNRIFLIPQELQTMMMNDESNDDGDDDGDDKEGEDDGVY